MKILIIGLGSIARKHLLALRQLEQNLEVYALRTSCNHEKQEGIISIYNWDEVPKSLSFAMVCNPTSEHYKSIQNLLPYNIPLFIEKPPFSNLDGLETLLKKIKEKGIRTYTAFNFRFHPVLNWVNLNLADKRIIEVMVYCGSYLPKWRPGKDYRDTYSARSEMGGGVHLDLIHELDYIFWMFGEPDSIQSNFLKVSDLEINSYDIARYWLVYEKFTVSLILNYYRRDSKRQLEIVFEDITWTIDLVNGTVVDSVGKTLYENKNPISETYRSQMEYFLTGLNKSEEYFNNIFQSSKLLEYALR